MQGQWKRGSEIGTVTFAELAFSVLCSVLSSFLSFDSYDLLVRRRVLVVKNDSLEPPV